MSLFELQTLSAEAECAKMLTVEREGQRAALTPHVPFKSTAVTLGQTQEVLLGYTPVRKVHIQPSRKAFCTGNL